ncbi:MAG: glycoside hydrolase family 2 TIM barrel-domain containing protein [Bacteroidota bacterium]
MKKKLLGFLLFLVLTGTYAQRNQVTVIDDGKGPKLVVNGKDFMINGMNWDYIPIGTNTVNAAFWSKSDDIIKAGIDKEMSLLKNMGVNAIRQYTGVPAKWIRYIYENYGIYTMLNHSFGRYGLTIDGVWTPVTIYDEPKTAELLMNEMKELVQGYKNTPGLLMYLLGNENNYGLFWAGAETEDFPDDEQEKQFIGEKRGRPMYRLMNEAAKMMKELDTSHPVAICNGDILFIDIIAEECKDIDIYGTNTYRGISFGDMFQVVKDKLNIPVMFTEFGADAYNAIENQEDQYSQAYYMVGNWKEIYENAAGLGKVGNSIGGFTFQFSDGWWKYGFDDRRNANVHDNIATWSNGGYARDLAEEGANNMNEEWFGICAKGATSPRGLYELYPRAAYYALKEAHQLNPYGEGVNLDFVQNHFDNIQLMDAMLKARGDKAALSGEGSNLLRISNLQARFSTFSTGGSLITTPDTPDPDDPNTFPNQLGFDHMESYFIGVEGNPASNMRAEVNLNVVGNVAQNPINEIFYENNSRPIDVNTDSGDAVVSDVNRIRVYQAEFEWNAKEFDIRGFYRTGHYHWGYEGDFFGFYPEANYGPNLDIYNGEILGAEIDGKGPLKGLKAAIGPQLWWGANPTMLFKYKTHLGKFDITGIYNRDFETDVVLDANGRRVLDLNQTRSGVIPPWPTERASLVLEREFGKFDVALGGIWAGSPLNDLSFQDVTGTAGNYVVFEDRIQTSDNWGGKAKITYEGGKFNWYGQASAMGLIANGGADQTITFTGWKLRDTGSGNVTSVFSGFTFATGKFQFAPNFMWQKPIVEAIPQDAQGPARLRNIIDDPFSVRANRETTAGELLITFDPTPGTWMYEWDNDRAEDAKFAMNLGFVYRHLPTTMDSHIGFNADREFFAFPNSAPAEDLWEVHSRIVSKIGPDFGMVGKFYYGNGQGNGDSQRLIKRFGGDVRILYKNFKLRYEQKINDWGPYDYHQDFNLTYPVQLMLDISTTLGKPDWFILPSTQVGIRGIWRSLNEFSPRYLPNQAPEFSNEPNISPVGFDNGNEWEIMTYVHINIGK